jgi:hypothetical protein
MNELAIRDEQHYLATIAEVRSLVTRIESVNGAKDLADQARAAQVWAERARLGQEKVNLAVAARLWAERRTGELLANTVVPRGNHRVPGKGSDPSLPDGVDKKQSHRWQKLAAIPPDTFAEITEEAVEAGRVNGAEVLRRWERRQREHDRAEEERRLVAEAAPVDCRLEVADLRDWNPGEVAAIITDPPYVTADAVELVAAVRDLALRCLRPGGALAVMTWQPILPAVLAALDHPELRYRWTIAYVSGAHESTADYARRVFDRWKPIVVVHRGQWADDAPMLADVISSGRDADKTEHEWQQALDGFRPLVRKLARPGEVVCDPFLGAGTTAIAAKVEGRGFVGCDIDTQAVAITQERLAA